MNDTLLKPSFRRAEFTLPWTFLLTLLLLSSCGSQKSSISNIDDYDSEKDYFPEKLEINHSIGFQVEYAKHYKTLHFFRHYNDVVDTISYALVQRGTPEPTGFEQDRIIQIPVERIVSLSTTHLTMFELLDAYDELKGIETAQYVHSKKVQAMVREGSIFEAAVGGPLNVEMVINANTDVVLGVGYPNSQSEGFQQLERTGIPVLLNADWHERDLLARAEWIKLIAVLLNKEGIANERFSAIEQEYQKVLDLLSGSVTDAPLTITGIAQGDVWHVAGGRSFAYNVLNVAKADYPWKDDTSTGSLKLDFETVYEFGLKAKIWVGPSHAQSLDQILQRDSRYADFESFKTKQVYNIYGRYEEGGGNDYYESGVMNPHILLKDVVKIFHPNLLPDHQLVYYAKLK